MENSLKLLKVIDAEEKTSSKDTKTYIRVKFSGIFNEKFNEFNEVDESDIRCSMSMEQWNDLKNCMKLSFENDKIITKNPIFIKFDPLGKTTSKNPKLLIKREKATLNGYPYDYWELNVGVLIQNEIVKKGIIKKDYSNLF